ncbi:MAG: hypothetical protein US89_C0009G0021 [Candidatus Peregrinibacteria bacterium GW2011_GWF2_38_29]|nr:MAG: hypothetical protein US89_C0009G0021 [Candidatus Peregrinibacteria bacterium GW2011_GWF2_38_29]HBB02799.1 ribonuclease P protein component [Candidatus Peregrinibacteria bacterium]
MLPKSMRLKKSEVEFLLDKGLKQRSNFFSIIFRKNNKSSCRFCVVVGKKLQLKPAQRTTLRRKIYEAIRKNLNQISNANLDAAFIPYTQINKVTPAEIEKEITYILTNFKKWAKTY